MSPIWASIRRSIRSMRSGNVRSRPPFFGIRPRARVRDRVSDWEQLYEVDSQAIFPTDKIGETGADRLVEFDSDELEYIEGGGSGCGSSGFRLGGRACRRRSTDARRALLRDPSARRSGRGRSARAWERVRYERYLGMLGNETSATQRLLFAETVPLSAAEACIAREIAGDLEAVGFDFRIGEESMTVTGIPADLPDVGVGQAVREMLSEFRESERLSPTTDSAHGGRDGALRSHDLPRCDGRRCGSGAFARMAPLRRIQLYADGRRCDGADRRRIG